MKLIGFHGPAGAGKDTCGAYLVEHFGFERLSFAAPIYDMLEIAGFGRPKDQPAKEANIEWLGKSWRHLAQTLGTEWGRQCVDPELWVKLAMHKVQSNPDKAYVITDVRFENEAKMIRATGGLVVHIRGRKAEGTLQHASEVPLALYPGDAAVHNDGDFDSLYNQLNYLLGK